MSTVKMLATCEVKVREGLEVFRQRAQLGAIELDSGAEALWKAQYSKTFDKALQDGFKWERAQAGVERMARQLGIRASELAYVESLKDGTPAKSLRITERNAREATFLVALDPACVASKKGGGGDWCEMFMIMRGFEELL